ncbi:hypothetical protein [Bradyrhizobium sp. WSM3983]|uniref:phage tail tube protein n=1 Tax=Bradyrhizobium sp. WSM3983 TaxID=1038867 RepID=UPI00040FF94A|nr:hypothetical protein [Bradyrhizobium sp. WSM3983]
MTIQKNYTLGRGKLYFAKFLTGTQNVNGERYIGNTPALGLKFDATMLDHYDSDQGIKEKDNSITLQVNREGTFTTDNVSPENLALLFFGTNDVLSVTGATVTGETFMAVHTGVTYQLGVTLANPAGARGIVYPGVSGTLFKVTDDAGSPATFTAGTDYNFDPVTGRLEILAGGAIVDGTTNIKVNYTTQTATQQRVISGSTPVEGLMRYISKNPAGLDMDYLLPWAKLTPDGDFTLKSDEWQQLKFKVEVLKRVGYEAMYINGRPA